MQEPTEHSLTNDEIARYSRQLLLPQIGVAGQSKLSKASVLVVGAGGLGSPVLQYLAAAGVSTLGVVDYDTLDLNNLHRQIIHTESNIGKRKVDSAEEYIKNLNSTVKVVKHDLLLDASNILDIIVKYDVVVDGTDNVATRYLLNDACVFTNKPLVSGGALRLEGQLNIFNYKDGPCYRCLYPTPPPAESVTNCNEGGVLGVVTGIIGSLQAMEVIKIIVGLEPLYHKKMLIFDALSGLRTINLRPKNKSCAVCSESRTITTLQDYVQFCGSNPTDKIQNLQVLPPNQRITVQQFANEVRDGNCLIIDVRQKSEIDICCIKNSVFVPLKHLHTQIPHIKSLKGEKDIYVVCKHGNDSQLGVQVLKEHGIESKDVIGGLDQWSVQIDPTFPRY